MANRVGTFTVDGNYNVKRARPFDARMLVNTLNDLLADDWKFAYNGMLTVVSSDPIEDNNGVYRLLDRFKPTLLSSWSKILDSKEVDYILKKFNGLIYVTVQTYPKWSQISPGIKVGDVIGIAGLNSEWSYNQGATSANFKLLTRVTQEEGYVTVDSKDIGIYNITIDDEGNQITISQFEDIDKLVTERALRADLQQRLKYKIDELLMEGDVDEFDNPVPLPLNIIDKYNIDPNIRPDDPNRYKISVQIPLAQATRMGLIKSSVEENEISVLDGKATINSVNVNKLSQTPGDTLIIGGGNGDVDWNNIPVDDRTNYNSNVYVKGRTWPIIKN